MKTFRLLLVALLLAGSASAQHHRSEAKKGDYSPTVYLVSSHEASSDAQDGACSKEEAAELNRKATKGAAKDYLETHRTGAQQTDHPQFVFATKNNKFSFAIGGFIALRGAYDFDGISDNIDFIPADIPVPGNYSSRQKVTLDASTSRIFLKAITNSRKLGRVVFYIDTDFRGGASGSYTPRLRSAYVSFKGLTLGRDITTFCDLNAAPNTIDFQGPNAYNLNFTTLIRYEIGFAQKHMTFGVAAELPDGSATYGENYEPINQRVPDFPMYLQVAWGADRSSHLRASAILRNPYMHKISTDSNTSKLGWGVQLSGTIKVCPGFRLFMNGTYGKGVSSYIQDLAGLGLDFTPNPRNPDLVQTLPVWGVQAAGQVNITRQIAISGGYSTVRVQHLNGYWTADQYKHGQYIFGNIFYSLTPRFKMAAEYLYGSRKDMNNLKNHANRVNLLFQYSF